jgi:hypothetical protein
MRATAWRRALLAAATFVVVTAGPATAFEGPASAVRAPNDRRETADVVEIVAGERAALGDLVTVEYSGFPKPIGDVPLGRYLALLCNPKVGNSGFDPVLDCLLLPAPFAFSESGSGTFEGIRMGDGGRTAADGGDRSWRCTHEGTADGREVATDEGPVMLYDRCYLTIRQGGLLEAAVDRNQIFPVRFVDPAAPVGAAAPPLVPDEDTIVASSGDVPVGVVVGVAGLAILAAAYLLLRRVGGRDALA